MTWFFITPLAIALVVTYFFKNCANEAAYLGSSVVIGSLILSLVLAPWQIKALLLLFVILASKRLLESIKPIDDDDNQIQLSYRGANYEFTPNKVEMNNGESSGKYRGQALKIPKPNNNTTTKVGLKYRGATVKTAQITISAIQDKSES